ncbi:hypothetical protein PLESTM_001794700 [Pleodorina starrii]|nr:hypothetical protein PLESTM_001794700 [Pleodorina starrii]
MHLLSCSPVRSCPVLSCPVRPSVPQAQGINRIAALRQERKGKERTGHGVRAKQALPSLLNTPTTHLSAPFLSDTHYTLHTHNTRAPPLNPPKSSPPPRGSKSGGERDAHTHTRTQVRRRADTRRLEKPVLYGITCHTRQYNGQRKRGAHAAPGSGCNIIIISNSSSSGMSISSSGMSISSSSNIISRYHHSSISNSVAAESVH